MKVLLDTNIVSLAMSADPAVLRELARTPAGEAAISVVTYAEIRFGLARLEAAGRKELLLRKRELFERLLDQLEVLAWDVDAAEAYAAERMSCESDGEPLDQADLMILAHAAGAGRALVTRDAALLRRNRKGSRKIRVAEW